MLLDLLVWCDFRRFSEGLQAGAATPRTLDRPPGDETANNMIVDMNHGNPPITSGSNHVTMAAKFSDDPTPGILDL